MTDERKVDYAEIEQALRKNGLAVLRKGNRNKLEVGRDGKTLVVYGTLLYSPERDKGYKSEDKLVNHIVAVIKARALKNEEIEGSDNTNHSPGKSHHGRHEKTTGHHSKNEPTTGHHKTKTFNYKG